MAVEFHNFSVQVKQAISDNIDVVLEECAAELESQTKRNTRVKTSKTKNSFRHKVVKSEHTAYIGSDEENAIWEEFGTGEHAINGDGRQGGWSYQDENGKWHYTTGKKPSRAFWLAYTALKGAIIKHIQESFKGL